MLVTHGEHCGMVERTLCPFVQSCIWICALCLNLFLFQSISQWTSFSLTLYLLSTDISEQLRGLETPSTVASTAWRPISALWSALCHVNSGECDWADNDTWFEEPLLSSTSHTHAHPGAAGVVKVFNLSPRVSQRTSYTMSECQSRGWLRYLLSTTVVTWNTDSQRIICLMRCILRLLVYR